MTKGWYAGPHSDQVPARLKKNRKNKKRSLKGREEHRGEILREEEREREGERE
jgi:hypothetical protein